MITSAKKIAGENRMSVLKQAQFRSTASVMRGILFQAAFSKGIIDRYAGTLNYQFDPAALVLLAQLQEQGQHREQKKRIYHLTWNLISYLFEERHTGMASAAGKEVEQEVRRQLQNMEKEQGEEYERLREYFRFYQAGQEPKKEQLLQSEISRRYVEKPVLSEEAQKAAIMPHSMNASFFQNMNHLFRENRLPDYKEIFQMANQRGLEKYYLSVYMQEFVDEPDEVKREQLAGDLLREFDASMVAEYLENAGEGPAGLFLTAVNRLNAASEKKQSDVQPQGQEDRPQNDINIRLEKLEHRMTEDIGAELFRQLAGKFPDMKKRPKTEEKVKELLERTIRQQAKMQIKERILERHREKAEEALDAVKEIWREAEKIPGEAEAGRRQAEKVFVETAASRRNAGRIFGEAEAYRIGTGEISGETEEHWEKVGNQLEQELALQIQKKVEEYLSRQLAQAGGEKSENGDFGETIAGIYRKQFLTGQSENVIREQTERTSFMETGVQEAFLDEFLLGEEDKRTVKRYQEAYDSVREILNQSDEISKNTLIERVEEFKENFYEQIADIVYRTESEEELQEELFSKNELKLLLEEHKKQQERSEDQMNRWMLEQGRRLSEKYAGSQSGILGETGEMTTGSLAERELEGRTGRPFEKQSGEISEQQEFLSFLQNKLELYAYTQLAQAFEKENRSYLSPELLKGIQRAGNGLKFIGETIHGIKKQEESMVSGKLGTKIMLESGEGKASARYQNTELLQVGGATDFGKTVPEENVFLKFLQGESMEPLFGTAGLPERKLLYLSLIHGTDELIGREQIRQTPEVWKEILKFKEQIVKDGDYPKMIQGDWRFLKQIKRKEELAQAYIGLSAEGRSLVEQKAREEIQKLSEELLINGGVLEEPGGTERLEGTELSHRKTSGNTNGQKPVFPVYESRERKEDKEAAAGQKESYSGLLLGTNQGQLLNSKELRESVERMKEELWKEEGTAGDTGLLGRGKTSFEENSGLRQYFSDAELRILLLPEAKEKQGQSTRTDSVSEAMVLAETKEKLGQNKVYGRYEKEWRKTQDKGPASDRELRKAVDELLMKGNISKKIFYKESYSYLLSRNKINGKPMLDGNKKNQSVQWEDLLQKKGTYDRIREKISQQDAQKQALLQEHTQLILRERRQMDAKQEKEAPKEFEEAIRRVQELDMDLVEYRERLGEKEEQVEELSRQVSEQQKILRLLQGRKESGELMLESEEMSEKMFDKFKNAMILEQMRNGRL